ncbi:hypothetical protein PT974_07323 [Cladobotryum mycophilum]|uniref:Uncharacterized protein n=1 Tax=Cladobotryum mycophilum TaxID=491253 RepID=A0ABR0SQ41_9HYPO
MSESAPTSYDPDSPYEHVTPVTPPPPVTITAHSILQPALSRRGVGPGLILILPNPESVEKGEAKDASSEFDPNPVKKWAEEGFSIVAITLPERGYATGTFDIIKHIEQGIKSLKAHWSVNHKDAFGLIIYDDQIADNILDYLESLPPQITALLAFSPSHRLKATDEAQVSYYARSGSSGGGSSSSQADSSQMPLHILKQNECDPLSARMVRTANLEFLKERLGGPRFELEAIWDEHTRWEFEDRSVAQTVNTMVDDAYVNHVPTMTGGRGREALTAFYRDHFIFCNPPDTSMKAISRTVGSDRVIVFRYKEEHLPNQSTLSTTTKSCGVMNATESQAAEPHDLILPQQLGVYNASDRPNYGDMRRSVQSFRSPKWLGYAHDGYPLTSLAEYVRTRRSPVLDEADVTARRKQLAAETQAVLTFGLLESVLERSISESVLVKCTENDDEPVMSRAALDDVLAAWVGRVRQTERAMLVPLLERAQKNIAQAHSLALGFMRTKFWVFQPLGDDLPAMICFITLLGEALVNAMRAFPPDLPKKSFQWSMMWVLLFGDGLAEDMVVDGWCPSVVNYLLGTTSVSALEYAAHTGPIEDGRRHGGCTENAC